MNLVQEKGERQKVVLEKDEEEKGCITIKSDDVQRGDCPS